MKTYRIKVTKDEREMIESALHQAIDLTKDAIHDNEFGVSSSDSMVSE